MSKIKKTRMVANSKNMKVTKKNIGKTLEETVEWIMIKFDISKSSKKIKRLTKTFTLKLAAELKYLAKKARKKDDQVKKASARKLKKDMKT